MTCADIWPLTWCFPPIPAVVGSWATGETGGRLSSAVVSARPTSLLLAALLVGVEVVVLLALAVWVGVDLAVATPDDRTRAVMTLVIAGAGGAGLLPVARGLARARRWSRAPALVANLLALPVGYDLLRAGRWYVGVPLLLVALAVVVTLLVPATTAALEADE